ncbi:hypothetical protein GCM10007973_17940 [Polymorphobacter multimanifer]|uniref:Cell envelope biogenesis protein TolA n=2 Tax=Polymorphobacter multimanifer TaxID=1070431 RepID=A0A841L120_9SPHN|nr:hypothetical protein [Polymorphobacter multimanifer]MBB6226254.1 hypothetical protein [Polymorphobacter multimanifer]GGI81900.1 hypothetical protein GCM10007973_17940 [Polymorphobacter multimanifer]
MKILMISTVLALGAAPAMAQQVPPTTDTMTPGATAPMNDVPTTAPAPQATPSAGGWTNDTAVANRADSDANKAEKRADKAEKRADKARETAERAEDSVRR